VLLAWEEHLRCSLQFPFEAEVDEFQERGPLQAGDRLTVLGIEAEIDRLAAQLWGLTEAELREIQESLAELG
jgi:hypothetical protein